MKRATVLQRPSGADSPLLKFFQNSPMTAKVHSRTPKTILIFSNFGKNCTDNYKIVTRFYKLLILELFLRQFLNSLSTLNIGDCVKKDLSNELCIINM